MSEQRRRPVSLGRAALWLAAIAAVLVAADLAQRLLLYDVVGRDIGRLTGTLRRPVKDTALAILQRLPSSADDAGALPVFDFYMKPDDERELRSQLTRLQIEGTDAAKIGASWLPARLTVDGFTYDARVRLRGLQYYHNVPPRPSLRVRLRRGQSYRGTRVFNLVDPFDKTTDQAFLWESLEHGLIGWDQTMGVMSLDGEPLAVVQYVEHVRRATGDHNRRAEGMFFKGTGRVYDEGADPERCAQVVADVTGWVRDPAAEPSFGALRARLDLGRLRIFTALTELSGSRHGFLPVNMKGYCDPVSLRAEFLIWDTNYGSWAEVGSSAWAERGRAFLRNDRYRRLHDETLYEIVGARVEPLLARIEAFFGRYGAAMDGDPFNWFPRGGESGGWMFERPARFPAQIRRNAQDIRAALEGEALSWAADEQRLLFWTGDRGSKTVTALRAGEREIPLDPPLPVYGRIEDHQPVVALHPPARLDPKDVTGVVAHNHHTGRPVAASRAEPRNPTVFLPEVEEQLAPPRLPRGFHAAPELRVVSVGPGVVHFDGAVRLPRGWSLWVAPGTLLRAGPDALLEVRGDLTMRGTPSAPVRIEGATDAPWGAIAVVGERENPARVSLRHTQIRGGQGSNAGHARYTATLAIYFAEVRLDHLEIEDGLAEDAINLKYASFEARDCSYRAGAGDAVDYDFSPGLDYGTVIRGFPDDGIDVSGSRVRIENALIRDVGDKALSLGEASQPEIVNVRAVDVNVGLAVKDLTHAVVRGLTVVRANTAVAAYTKKISFGPASADIRGLVAIDVGGLAVIDSGSEASFAEGVRIGGGEPRMRAQVGVENRVVPGLARRTSDELLELAERSRLPLAEARPAAVYQAAQNR